MAINTSELLQDLHSANLILMTSSPLSLRCRAADVIIGSIADLALDDYAVATMALWRRKEVERILSLAMHGIRRLASQSDILSIEFKQPEQTLQLARHRLHRICLVCEINPDPRVQQW